MFIEVSSLFQTSPIRQWKINKINQRKTKTHFPVRIASSDQYIMSPGYVLACRGASVHGYEHHVGSFARVLVWLTIACGYTGNLNLFSNEQDGALRNKKTRKCGLKSGL